ncbi:MAG: hypothetical protein WCJ30_00715 [Deltaproteobacteria bacterium]
MLSRRLAVLLALVVAPLALAGCPAPPAIDGGLDGGNRGLVRWGSIGCNAAYDGGPRPADACTVASQHTSNTGINAGSSPATLRCVTRVTLADRTVVVGFSAHEALDPASSPGSLELRGVMSAVAASPTTVGQPVQSCEVRLAEGTHTAVGHCGAECTVTVTNYYEDVGTLSGTIRCGAMPDDSTPTVFRDLRQSNGVPGMAADFSLNGCDPAP